MRQWAVTALGCKLAPQEPVDILFLMRAATFEQAVRLVDDYLRAEKIPFHSFEGATRPR